MVFEASISYASAWERRLNSDCVVFEAGFSHASTWERLVSPTKQRLCVFFMVNMGELKWVMWWNN